MLAPSCGEAIPGAQRARARETYVHYTVPIRLQRLQRVTCSASASTIVRNVGAESHVLVLTDTAEQPKTYATADIL